MAKNGSKTPKMTNLWALYNKVSFWKDTGVIWFEVEKRPQTAKLMSFCHHSCQAVGHTCSDKAAWITHLLGGKNACPHASPEAKAEATAQHKATKEAESSKKHGYSDAPAASEEPLSKKHRQHPALTQSTLTVFRRNDMPYSESEKAAVQRQALRAIVSAGFPMNSFEDPEALILFGMMRSTDPAIMPTGKVVGGRLPNNAAAEVEDTVDKALRDRYAGPSTDGWKHKKRDAVNALCANINFRSYLIELVEVTALDKDGPSLCDLFADMIDRIKEKYGCIIIYFTTDTDGGSKKGRILLVKKRPWLILPLCSAHQFQLILGDYFKVNDIAAVLAGEAISLFILKDALQLAVIQNRTAIINAEVSAAVSTKAEALRADAERFGTLIGDTSFWSGLETILGNLEPICFGTNINQKDSTCLNQVPLTIAGIFCTLPTTPRRKLNNRPDNEDTPETKKTKEMLVSKAIMQYLAGLGDFSDFNAAEWEMIRHNTDPIRVWQALCGSAHLAELATFAITILEIVANEASCERTFLRTKIEESDYHNRLSSDKMEKRTRNNEDPSERGRTLVFTPVGWRTQVAKWIGDAEAADDDEENTPVVPDWVPAWRSMTLKALFGEAEKPRKRKPSWQVMEEEEILM
ncbi:hypothetical protein B0H16DRAFT_1474563 [Mycena metata]|uniref:DUF659 domain-containing protein n=1 Tax=Mycena metata TaxID=1033252 RepID=A0AAD7HH71_9AGAR|nr:hypothetical protein B0H16DRAFT_1474563 [Mycena metata]